MHIIVLPSKWTKDADDYRARKDQIYSKIKNENTAEVVVKVSMLSKITAVIESLNSNAYRIVTGKQVVSCLGNR